MKENELITMSVASLASLGDSSSAKLNKAALQFVTAPSQSAGALRMLDHLSEEELSFYKRGRNHKTSHCPKSADPEEYQRATGLEVLFAFLYLQKKQDRIAELFSIGFLNK